MKKNVGCRIVQFKFYSIAMFFAIVSISLVAVLSGNKVMAASDATLSLIIAPQTINIGDTFTVVANENPGTNTDVRAVDMAIQFDPTVLQLNSIVTNALTFPVEMVNSIPPETTAGTAVFGAARITGVALVGSQDVATLTFTALATGINSAINLTSGSAVWDSGVNVTATGGLYGAVVTVSDPSDVTGPTVAEVTPVAALTNDATPSYTFSSTEVGLITYGGDCSSSTTIAAVGNNTVVFNTLAQGAHSNCTIIVTDASSNASSSMAVTSFTVDSVSPTLAQVTPVTTPTKDTTPNYTFSSTEVGTITYGGSCSSATTSAIAADNIITFNTLASGVYSNCTIVVTDAAGNASSTLAVSTFTIDTTAPTLAQVTPVTTPTNDPTPNYTFSSTEVGTITYGGSCSSVTTAAVVGNNAIVFDALVAGTYSNCTITVTDAATNASTPLAVSSFTIDVTAPTVAEVTPVTSPTTDPTPSYVFSSNEVGTITYGGSCSSATTSAVSGNNTVVFATLSDATYSNCTIVVTDASGNASSPLDITTFTVEATSPTLAQVTPITTPTNDPTPNYTFSSTEVGTITYGGSCSSVTTSAVVGNNAIVFDALVAGTYSNCIITVTDAATNASTPLAVSSFTIDVTAPTVAEVTPITSPTTDNTPSYVFSSTEVGTITYGGDCSSSTTSAVSGNNTVVFGTLSVGTHSNCTIVVTDAADNASSSLDITSFEVTDGSAPSISDGSPSGTLDFGTTQTTLMVTTNENATCKYSTTAGVLYDSMTNTFETTGSTSQSTPVTGLNNGTNYSYYVRCADGTGNKNDSDYSVSFSVDDDPLDDSASDDGDNEIDIPKPKAEFDDESKSVTSYFRKNKKIKLAGKIEDIAGGEVKLKIDGDTEDSDTLDEDGNWKVAFDLRETNEIKLYFYNANGNEVGSKKYKIKIDSEAPIFEDIPAVLKKKIGDKLWWKVSDNKAVDHYRYTIYGRVRDSL